MLSKDGVEVGGVVATKWAVTGASPQVELSSKKFERGRIAELIEWAVFT